MTEREQNELADSMRAQDIQDGRVPRPKSTQATRRIEDVHMRLRARGFRPLSAGKFGLPSYNEVSAWSRGRVILYLLTRHDDGGYDIVTTVDNSNRIDRTWDAIDRLTAADDESAETRTPSPAKTSGTKVVVDPE